MSPDKFVIEGEGGRMSTNIAILGSDFDTFSNVTLLKLLHAFQEVF